MKTDSRRRWPVLIWKESAETGGEILLVSKDTQAEESGARPGPPPAFGYLP